MLEWIYVIAFYALSLMLVMSALGVLFLRNIFHAGLSLLFALFVMAGLFVLLGAEFVAGIQVLVYVGAIAVLILFAVMLTQRIADTKIKRYTRALFPGLLIGLGLIAVAFLMLGNMNGLGFSEFTAGDMVPEIGRLLLSDYLLAFELISLLLLGALVGAIVLATKEGKEKKEEE